MRAPFLRLNMPLPTGRSTRIRERDLRVYRKFDEIGPKQHQFTTWLPASIRHLCSTHRIERLATEFVGRDVSTVGDRYPWG